jgi:two-component system, LuxR family, sensor kinase FixL
VLHGEHIFTGVIEDLAREKAAQERERALRKQALQNERLADVGAMTAQIAHDLGNPLAGLRMTGQRMLQLLGRDPLPVDRLRQATDIVVATIDRLDALIGEFKEFAREQRLELRDIALAPFLLDVGASWRHEAEERGVALEVEDVGATWIIRADEDKLRRVMDNLMKNALEAIERGPGVVRIAVESRNPDRVSILVSDTGPGIPEGTDVFALFETTKPTGTGLGLSICKQIVLAHGGGIEHADRFPRGTVFRVELPAHGPTPWL